MEKLPEDVMIEETKSKLKRKKIIDRFDQDMEEKLLLLEEDVKIEEKPKPKRKKIISDRDFFWNLPEDVMIEKILLKLPGTSLSKLRYVCKHLWSLITNPSFVKLHLHHSTAQINNHLLLMYSYTYKHGSLGPNKPLYHSYTCNFTTTSNTSSSSSTPEILEMHCPFEPTVIVQASCNGLLYLHRRVVDEYDGRYVDSLNYIWNPCTKEYKELPPPPPLVPPSENYVTGVSFTRYCRFSSISGFCGFGYDRTNDEYKILHYENYLVDPSHIRRGSFVDVTHVSSTVEFKLYTLGKNTWTSIIDNPYKSFFFSEPFRKIGLLVNGALHWIMCLSNSKTKGKIVSFDFGKEVFREVQKPHYYFREEEDQPQYYESLQVLQECLCMCQVHPPVKMVCKIDIWLLRDYDVLDSWTNLFRILIPIMNFSHGHFTLLRYFENNGEILMLRNMKDVIMYDPLNHKARLATKFNESTAKLWPYYMDYTESLVSLNSGTYSYRTS